ncbi:MAG: PleD family two-component response regulator, partial [Candidatus Marinamargulisbacteria bacterium]
MAKKRILIIDDSETQLAAYRKVFKLAKFDVVT